MNLSQRMLELQKGINLSSLVASLGSDKNRPRKVEKVLGVRREKMVTNVVWNLLYTRYHSTFAFII